MFEATAQLVSLGCDYITATAKRIDGITPLSSIASALFRSEAEMGQKVKGWSMSGFKGWKCGQVETGQLDDMVLLRCMSDVAHRSWRSVWEAADNVSRLDLEVTVLTQLGVANIIDTVHDAALVHAEQRNNKPIVRWIRDNRGGYTLYLGARTSNSFGRAYDKFGHTKERRWTDCVRFEVQFQNDAAVAVGKQLSCDKSPRPRMAGLVSQFFQRRGVHLELSGAIPATYSCSRRRPDVEQTLAWLAQSVRPSVERLMSAGMESEVFAALGLIDSANPDGPTSTEVGP